tara:strand:- start:1135 stop:1770 length:636 start_codon:yes stop_codon:yes gene_type:complete
VSNLKVECVDHSKFPYIVADNWYSPEEEKLIWQELDFLSSRKENFRDAEDSDGKIARNKETKEAQGKHKRLYPEDVFNKRSYSNILSLNHKQLLPQFYNFAISSFPQGRHWQTTNKDTTMISYYENTDYYKAHWDSSITTILRWFYREPKKYTGGDLTFTESGEKIKCKHNRMIMFPGYYLHEVDPIKMEEEHKNKNLGRYTLTTFYYYSS